MATSVFAILLVFFATVYTAAGTVHLGVNPANITSGLTRELTVNCSHVRDETSNIFSIISLILSRANINNQQQFVDLESINIFDTDHVIEVTELNATVSGKINASGDSYLSIQWPYPTEAQSGVYKCEINGLDSTGHPTQIFQTALVTSQMIDMEQLIKTVTELQRQLDRQENTAELQKGEINSLLSLTQNQSSQITMLQSQLDLQNQIVKNQSDIIISWQSNMNVSYLKLADIFDNTFHISSLYQNQTYLLSKQTWFDADRAETICESYGGHLAEVDDANEHQFIKTFLGQFPEVHYVLISGTDRDHQGVWRHTFTPRQLTYTDWYTGEPNQQQNHCLQIYQPNNWQMFDFPCASNDVDDYFLCEVYA